MQSTNPIPQDNAIAGATSSNKRPLPSRSTQGYPRKRAMKACKTCRLRKTKCNNERPTCGFCQSLGALCDYEDEGDFSVLDPASQVIVQKLDEVLQKLDENSQISRKQLGELRGSLVSRNREAPSPPTTTGFESTHGSLENASSEASDDRVAGKYENELFTPAFCTAPDAILSWPIFGQSTAIDHNHITDALFQTSISPREINYNITDRQLKSIGISELHQFLDIAHFQSPLLGHKRIWGYHNNIGTSGYDWDEASCLVLLVAALATRSHNFGSNPSTEDLDQSVSRSKLYYTAARQRAGFLGSDLLSTQCLYFLGIYELTLSNPIQAWKWFSLASSSFIIYQRAQELIRQPWEDAESTESRKRMEASLYWSCYKAMCEIRSELPLPPSVLAEVDYSQVLPSPPTDFTNVMGFDPMGSTVFGPYNGHLPQLPYANTEEESWLFYLTDIILSRLKNRILRTLYDNDPTHWKPENLNKMLQAVNEFECKIQHWHKDLPPSLRFDLNNDQPTNFTNFLLYLRTLELNSILFRPFLYYLIHHYHPSSPGSTRSNLPPCTFPSHALLAEIPESLPHPQHPTDSTKPIPLLPEEVERQIYDFARKAIETSLKIISTSSFLDPRFQWQGRWSLGRLLLSSALMVAATGKADLEEVLIDKRTFHHSNWRDHVKRASGVLKTWTVNLSPDLVKGVEILESLASSG